ncbi:hypothetical protein [Streptomyces sp. WM6372]|nr:hypothetical protein [Streptomyces sp. WM6372]
MNDVLSLAADLLTIAGSLLSVVLEVRREREHNQENEDRGGEETSS